MLSYMAMIGRMACLFAVATVLQNIRYSMVDNDFSPVVQSILQILCLILWTLSLPVTIVAYFLWLPKHNRQEALHKKELAAKTVEGFEMLNRKMAPLEKELAAYRELASLERSDGYRKGRQDARAEYEQRLSHDLYHEYKRGYLDARDDFPLGINRIAEIESDFSGTDESPVPPHCPLG